MRTTVENLLKDNILKQIIIFTLILFFLGCSKEDTVNTLDDSALISESESIENKITVTNDEKNDSLGSFLFLEMLEAQIDTMTKRSLVEPYYYQQWYLEHNETFYMQNGIDPDANIHTNNLLNFYTGKGVKIAIIDDGLDVLHEDLNGSIINTFDIATQTTDVSHKSEYGFHGTSVTGIIGARVNGKGIHGIASESEIIFIKHQNLMSDSETIELFSQAEAFGADIINCSWGTYDVSEAVKEKIQDLAVNGRDSKGILIIFAVGNDNINMGNDESAIPEVIAVGASDKENLRAWYSNFGEHLDILAPGGYDIGLTTLDTMGSDGISSLDQNYLLYDDFNSFIGTSASAPIVSGVIALMLEADPSLSRVEIEEILKNTSDKIGGVGYENLRNDYYGYGKINLNNIMNFLNQ